MTDEEPKYYTMPVRTSTNRSVVLAAFVTFACLVALGIIGYIVMAVIKPEKSDQYFAVLLQLLGLASIAGGYFWGQNKQNQKIETIKRQTNGTLSTLIERVDEQASTIKKQEAIITKQDNIIETHIKGASNE
jgi:phage shock protein PspC (stress-responsive transcriptional regulator)